MDHNNLSKNSLLIALGVVASVGIIGASLSHDSAVQIIGFCSFICVALLNLLQQIKVAEKQEETKTAMVAEITKNAEQTRNKVATVSQKLDENTMLTDHASAKADEAVVVAKAVAEQAVADTQILSDKLDIIAKHVNGGAIVEQERVGSAAAEAIKVIEEAKKEAKEVLAEAVRVKESGLITGAATETLAVIEEANKEAKEALNVIEEAKQEAKEVLAIAVKVKESEGHKKP